jgi:endogenous inhibitor of DNA gyrase (YacG/DUF329 family)/very-short-patch-repair endonuclease
MQCRVTYYKNHPTEHPQWTGGMIEKTCPVCQKHFRVKRSHSNSSIHCSKACYGKAQAERQKGDNNPSKTEAARKKLKQMWLLRPRQQKVFLKCPICNKMFSVRPSEIKKGRRFCSKSCSNASWSVRVLHPLPNRPELALQKLLDNYFPNTWKYTGDGSFLVGWYNPDFVNCNGCKDIIELFGDYWHSMKVIKKKWARTELGRVMAYNSLGYRCLVIWEYELKNEDAVVAKIEQFMKVTESHHGKVKKGAPCLRLNLKTLKI